MKVAIFGTGGVGGYYGGKLAGHFAGDPEVEVVFIARGRHLEEIRKNGLELITQAGTFRVRPDMAIDDPAGHGIFDLVLFCVKTYDLEEGASRLKDNLTANSMVITVLNGVDNQQRLKRLLPEADVINGCVYISSKILRPGVVQQSGGSCQLFFGQEGRGKEKCLLVEGLLRKAGIDAEFRPDIERLVWEKYLFICPAASATAYFAKTFGELMENDERRKFLENLVLEVEKIGRSQGILMPDNAASAVLDKVASFPKDTKSSLQMDFERGARTELETFAGFMLKAAAKQGIAVPYHKEVYKTLKSRTGRPV